MNKTQANIISGLLAAQANGFNRVLVTSCNASPRNRRRVAAVDLAKSIPELHLSEVRGVVYLICDPTVYVHDYPYMTEEQAFSR